MYAEEQTLLPDKTSGRIILNGIDFTTKHIDEPVGNAIEVIIIYLRQFAFTRLSSDNPRHVTEVSSAL